jgi:hypothetical protein
MVMTMTDKQSNPTASAQRSFRRLRARFKKDAGLKELTVVEAVLIDQAAILALQVRQMRDDILAGEKPVDGDDLVRTANACIRAMGALRTNTRGRATESEPLGPQAPVSDLDPIEIFLREKREREEAANG